MDGARAAYYNLSLKIAKTWKGACGAVHQTQTSVLIIQSYLIDRSYVSRRVAPTLRAMLNGPGNPLLPAEKVYRNDTPANRRPVASRRSRAIRVTSELQLRVLSIKLFGRSLNYIFKGLRYGAFPNPSPRRFCHPGAGSDANVAIPGEHT